LFCAGVHIGVHRSGFSTIFIQPFSTGVLTTLAGSSSGSTDATGTSASFNHPRGITTDGTNLYVADYSNNRIRKIVISTGVLTTLAGSSSGPTDATGTSARFNGPMGITTDGTNLYVADTNSQRIRKIVISTGVVTTLAGSSSGSTEATGTSARFNTPGGKKMMERIYMSQIIVIIEFERLSNWDFLPFLKISEHSETNCF